MTIISQTKQLDDLCLEIDTLGRFSLDLEFIPEYTYSPQLCLVQIGTDKGVYIIDPFIVEDLSPLWQKVADAKIFTVLHAGKQDLDLIFNISNLVPQNVIDTQIAAGFLGHGYPIGYGKLVQLILDVSLSKTESYTTWNNRPLTQSQIEYALDDVRYLLPVYDRLVKLLESADRLTWVKEECDIYCETKTYVKKTGNSFFRIKGANTLSRRQLQVLKELDTWRHKEAISLNRPFRSLIQDNLLIELARRSPHSIDDLMRMRGLNSIVKKQWSKPILEAVKQAAKVPESDCPQWAYEKILSKPQNLIVDILFLALKIICHKHNLAAELVATKKDLEQLILLKNDIDAKNHLDIMSGWRYDIAGKQLDQVLLGSTFSLSVNENEDPVEIEIDACHLERNNIS
jgi:ribonuclease D